MEAIDKIREAGLKLTPQRKAVYEAMMELRHAPIEAIISCVQSKDKEITLSTQCCPKRFSIKTKKRK